MGRTKEERTEIVENYRASGLTVRRFCKDAGIGEQSLRNWVARHNQVNGENPEQGFIEVPSIGTDLAVPEDQSGDPITSGLHNGLSIRFPDNVIIEVHPDTDPHLLGWVLSLMANRT
jgi:hypothetical protein